MTIMGSVKWMESATEVPDGTSDTDVNLALLVTSVRREVASFFAYLDFNYSWQCEYVNKTA